ncbi:hypothetical protein BJ508DRAFT_308226 [Ascobolus immersus RN42]|uniref:Uncharacterized protein n=1 Tax=Ascobolus immersus RN42 TaxID=1160509 RepID=A0A3N4I678_ASCIM|nr:hypothetical protein BJ508DRAFT_308226 [Ascobolus immersus RN42]
MPSTSNPNPLPPIQEHSPRLPAHLRPFLEAGLPHNPHLRALKLIIKQTHTKQLRTTQTKHHKPSRVNFPPHHQTNPSIGSSSSPASSMPPRRPPPPTLPEALSYISLVKASLPPSIFRSFVITLHKYREGNIGVTATSVHIASLLANSGHEELLEGFKRFLPRPPNEVRRLRLSRGASEGHWRVELGGEEGRRLRSRVVKMEGGVQKRRRRGRRETC